MGQGQHKGHDIGRWAHINVKLHFFLIISEPHPEEDTTAVPSGDETLNGDPALPEHSSNQPPASLPGNRTPGSTAAQPPAAHTAPPGDQTPGSAADQAPSVSNQRHSKKVKKNRVSLNLC